MQELLTIGRAAEIVGLNPRTIRYYEQISLVPAPKRGRPGRNGYRLFDQRDLNRLDFIRKGRLLGLSLAEVKELLTLTENGLTPPQFLSFIRARISRIDERIQNLQSLRRALEDLRRRMRRGRLVQRSCCEPVCGPITCEPRSQKAALVPLARSARTRKEAVHV